MDIDFMVSETRCKFNSGLVFFAIIVKKITLIRIRIVYIRVIFAEVNYCR